jgi:hypothetical protein
MIDVLTGITGDQLAGASAGFLLRPPETPVAS